MTPRLPRGTTVPGFVLEQTTTKQWLKQTLEDKLDERRFFYVWDDWLNFFFLKLTNYIHSARNSDEVRDSEVGGKKKFTIHDQTYDNGLISSTFFVTSDWSRIISVDKLMRG